MGVNFRGGELVQKGRGIGGFFRSLASIFKPIVKTVGSSVVKAVKSDTAKDIANTLATQAIDSSLNMSKDLIMGNDLKQSFQNEQEHFKERGGEIIENYKNVIDRLSDDVL